MTGGAISVESEGLGKGSLFIFSIPMEEHVDIGSSRNRFGKSSI